ncbi:peptidylprolyl isomerase [Siccibacter turicensis]|uniref:Periplasmic chaperone PpiD n=1 Tax=Siccibacter turicensis TaxID=357233 RepID=A0A2P8VP11_9ENTR|nr:peptidylprolyl isomerase [Siccibacter turicensis]PSN09299.1 peptidylprolyl isomerase [Siccibacter turicensis]
MMDNLRASANHLVLKIILGLIIVSFVLTGVGNYLIGGNSNYAAKVNGQEINRAQFEGEVMRERTRLQNELGEQFSVLAADENFMKRKRQEVLNQMIDQALLDQYAKSLGLGISDAQIKQAIFNTPMFQTDGKFDNQRFTSLLAANQLTPDSYAQSLRNQLLNQQVVNAVLGTDFTLKGEADEIAALVSQQRVVRQAAIDVKALAAKQQISDAEINAWYNAHKNEYLTPEQYRVSYIKLDAATMAQQVSDAEIQAYYDEHQAEFTTPARHRYSVIQTKTEDQAKQVLDALKKGEDFAALAKTKSTDIISARNGGDMGWLEESTTPDELKNAKLTEKGQLSDVITSSVGFLVARLDDTQPAQVKPLAEVRDAIVAKVKQNKALDAYFALQQKVSEAATNDNTSLQAAEQVAGVKAVQTGWFSQNQLPEELNFKPVADAIFGGSLVGANGAPGNNSDIITVEGDRAFVLRITDHKAEAAKPLDEVRTQVVDTLKLNKARQQANQDAQKLLTALKSGKGDEALKAAGLSFGEAKTLSRNAGDRVSQAAFNLPLPAKDKPSYGVADNEQGNVVLLALDEVRSGTMPEEQKKAMTKGLAQNNASIAFDALMQNLRKEAKIKYGDMADPQQ